MGCPERGPAGESYQSCSLTDSGTASKSSIFYVDNQGQLWEKRRNHTTNYWDQIQSIQNRSSSSNISPPDPLPISPGNDSPHKNNGEPENGWDVYRMTAVYSEIFESGAGCRPFYHSSNASSVVQELIRNENEEDWSRGATFDAYPNFHLSATIDDSTRILRLFYSTGGRALQYSWEYYKKRCKVRERCVQFPPAHSAS